MYITLEIVNVLRKYPVTVVCVLTKKVMSPCKGLCVWIIICLCVALTDLTCELCCKLSRVSCDESHKVTQMKDQEVI